MLQSIGSARIEGNNTSLLEYIETKLEEKIDVPMGVKEIQNIESAMDFIENKELVTNHKTSNARCIGKI